jgi:hypothetical protein
LRDCATLLTAINPDNVETKAKEGKEQYIQPTEKDLQLQETDAGRCRPLASNPSSASS